MTGPTEGPPPGGSLEPVETAVVEPGSLLEVRRETTGSTVAVVLRGELDITTLPRAEEEVQAAAQDRPATLVIDLSRLDFVDSSGIRLVLLADERARTAGRALAVRLGTGPARRVFDLLGLLDRLTVLDGPGDRPDR